MRTIFVMALLVFGGTSASATEKNWGEHLRLVASDGVKWDHLKLLPESDFKLYPASTSALQQLKAYERFVTRQQPAVLQPTYPGESHVRHSSHTVWRYTPRFAH